MGRDLLEISAPRLAYIYLGGFVVFFSVLSRFLQRHLYVNEVFLGTALGVILGPHVSGLVDPYSWGPHTNLITLEFMRIVLAVGLFSIGVELPRAYMAKHAKGLAVMVIPTMAFGWVIVAGVLSILFPQLNFVSCLAIAACLTPTDPIICSTIVSGSFAVDNVPLNLRHILSAESAANDGLAYPFLSIALYLTIDSSSKTAVTHWLLIGCLYEVILGTAMGAVLGFAFSRLLKISRKHNFLDRDSYVIQYLALAIFVTGLVSTLGSDDLLAAFAAGCAISWDGEFKLHTEGQVFSSVIDLFLNCGCFIYIGAWLPFDLFTNMDLGVTPARLGILLLAILLLRRIPPLMLLYPWIPEIRNWREAFFSGHFGPMGVGAVFISTLALHRLPIPHSPPENQQEILATMLQPLVAFVIMGSIIIHGLSISFFHIGLKARSGTYSLIDRATGRWKRKRQGYLLVPTEIQ